MLCMAFPVSFRPARSCALLLAAFFGAIFAAAHALAQPYPSKLIGLIVVYPPGGTSDGVARSLADKLIAQMGQQVIANAEINKALAAPDLADRLVTLDNVPSPGSVEQFAKTVRAEYEANARIVAKAHIRAD